MGRDREGSGMNAAREHADASPPSRQRLVAYLFGPLTRFGLIAALIVCAIDQAVKVWLLEGFDLANRGIVHLTPFLDFVLTWNTGISYGLFPQESDFGRYVLLAVKAGAVLVLWIWLARAESRLTALALGLIIGGALGNAIDRVAYGAVMDFVLFHITTPNFSFTWYVFNLADAAIVAGVVGLLYESLLGGTPQKRPDPPE
jgi:signal peptidase II